MYSLDMCNLEKNLWFCVQFIRAYPRNLIAICKKTALRQGKFVYSCHIQGDFPQILFSDGLYMIAFVHEDLAREYEKLVGDT